MSPGKRYSYLAFFDLDMTILSVNSANILVKESIARNMLSRQQVRNAILLSFLYKLQLHDTTRIIRRMLRWLEGLTEENVNSVSGEIFKRNLVHFLRPEILREIELHRSHDAGIVLLSSATSFACNPVARYLEMDDVICSRIGVQNGYLTGHTVGKLVFGPEKKHRLLNYCRSKNYRPEQCYYYGDSIADIHVLEAVGYPVCVYPDKKLRKVAEKRGWKIIDNVHIKS
ncbi:MAG: HAD family phosphatase [Bacteroidales bacterium]|nr:HAD family phosphatase [Bacteroidales bacterium]MBN2698385.1 HAD family phosphatase [Bacteroidales bacterium]